MIVDQTDALTLKRNLIYTNLFLSYHNTRGKENSIETNKTLTAYKIYLLSIILCIVTTVIRKSGNHCSPCNSLKMNCVILFNI